MNTRWLRHARQVGLMFCVWLLPLAALAQFDTAAVLGTVRDSTQAIIPGAHVTLTNNDTGVVQTTQTDHNGNYQFNAVPIGNYRVTGEFTGFSVAIAPNVTATINSRQRVDLVLQPGEATQTVTVTDAVKLLSTDESVLGQVISSHNIVNIPLNGRSYADLSLLVPGVRESTQNGKDTSSREASYNVNGQRNTFNNFLLDGVDNNSYQSSNQGFSSQVIQIAPDAIAEFKVMTNSYDAGYGRSSGAVINVTSKSGTNKFHGVAYEFLRNTALDAIGYFKPSAGTRTTLVQNQFGFTFGGPIVRDRTFFFLDYEGYRNANRQLAFSTIPSLAQRDGILSVAVKDPFTGATYAAGTSIPMTSFASKVLHELPTPNVSSAAVANNYSTLEHDHRFDDQFDLRLDHFQNSKLHYFVRASQRKSNEFQAPNITGPSGGGGNGTVRVQNRALAAGVTYALSSRSLLEARLGITRTLSGKQPPNVGGPSMFDLYGIPGLTDDPTVRGGLTTQTITGYSALGRQATNPQWQNPNTVNIPVNYTLVLGRHSLKMGVEYLLVNSDVNDTNPLMGSDTYNGQFSRPGGAAKNNLYNLADFMFGARAQYALGTFHVTPTRQREYNAYFQDDYKVSQRLTLNMGLRYEFATPIFYADNQAANFDPKTGTLVQAKSGSLADRALVNPDYKDFAPRLGFSFQAHPRTVVRGGFGIGYDHFNRMASIELLGTNYPYVTRSNVVQTAADLAAGVCTGNDYAGCFRKTEQGYPTNLPNNIVLYTPKDKPTEYVESWDLDIQQELAPSVLFDLAYVGNHGVHLVMEPDFNQASPTPAGTPVSSRRPFPGFGTISTVWPYAGSSYHGLQAKIEVRNIHGVYLINSFTWSKTMDNGGQGNETTVNPQNFYDLASDWGVSAYNEPLNDTLGFVVDLPVGHGRKFGAHSPTWLDEIIGGWRLSGVNTMRSGLPINLTYSPSPVTDNPPAYLGGAVMRPNILGPIYPEHRTITNYFNKANIVIPPAAQPFGNAQRFMAVGLPRYQLNAGLQKTFPIAELFKLELRGEAFNLLNKTNFSNPSGTVSSNAFGTITSTDMAREVQLAVKLSW